MATFSVVCLAQVQLLLRRRRDLPRIEGRDSITTGVHYWALILAAWAAVLPSHPLSSQTPDRKLVGFLVDHESGKALPAVQVRATDLNRTAVSGAFGRFELADLPLGLVQLIAERVGYETRVVEVDVVPSGVTEVTIRMSGSPVELPPVEVVARSRWLTDAGFYDRRDTGGNSGTFITRADLERRSPRQLTDLLDDLTFARVIPLDPGKYHVRFNRFVSLGGQSRSAAQRSPLDQRGCEPDLYIDGQRQRNSSPPMSTSGAGLRMGGGSSQNKVDDFNVIGITAIDAVEIYVGSRTPPQYSSPCGVIVVWTRRR